MKFYKKLKYKIEFSHRLIFSLFPFFKEFIIHLKLYLI